MEKSLPCDKVKLLELFYLKLHFTEYNRICHALKTADEEEIVL